MTCSLQQLPGNVSVKMEPADTWFGGEAGGGGNSARGTFPPLADLFRDPAQSGSSL
jgi:hypothetical protein